MTNTKTGAGAVFDFVQTDALEARLVALEKKHEQQVRVSQGWGVRSAIKAARRKVSAAQQRRERQALQLPDAQAAGEP